MNLNLNIIPSPRKIVYFDIYRTDYDTIKKEAIIKIENNFNIQYNLDIPKAPIDSHEIIPLLPQHLNFANLIQIAKSKKEDSLWHTLRLIYDDEVTKYQRAWENKNKKFVLTWNNVQNNLVKQFSYHKNSHSNLNNQQYEKEKEKEKLFDADQIEHLPGLLEEFSYEKLFLQKFAVEKELEQKCNELLTEYKQAFKQFEQSWFKFRKFYFTLENDKENRRKMAITEKNGELLSVNQQYMVINKWFKNQSQMTHSSSSPRFTSSFRREDEDYDSNGNGINKKQNGLKKIKINIVYGHGHGHGNGDNINSNYSIEDYVVLRHDDLEITVKEWFENVINTKFGNVQNDINMNLIEAFIAKHGKMVDNLIMKNYNWNVIDCIILKIISYNNHDNLTSTFSSNKIQSDNLQLSLPSPQIETMEKIGKMVEKTDEVEEKLNNDDNNNNNNNNKISVKLTQIPQSPSKNHHVDNNLPSSSSPLSSPNLSKSPQLPQLPQSPKLQSPQSPKLQSPTNYNSFNLQSKSPTNSQSSQTTLLFSPEFP